MDAADNLEGWLEHAGWVRALGIELVGAGDADDLVQDAWVAALERPARAERPGAWLSGVLRNLARRRRRADERRTRREQVGARNELQPGPDELVAEAEVQQRLLAAVTALEEPFRATVLLRFYRGWTPDEIARAQGVPAATVRTRLHRALARLRERLDREHGGRAAWALAFASPGTITGGALLGTKAMLAGAAVVAAVGGFVLWEKGTDVEGEPARVERSVAAADVAPAGAAGLPPAAPPAASAPAERVALAPDSAGARVSEVLLYGSVVDERGKPVALEFSSVEAADGETRSASRPPPGSYSIAGLAPGPYRLSVRARGCLDLAEDFELRADAEHVRHDLVLARGLAIPVKIVDELGVPYELDGPSSKPALDVVVTRDAPRAGLCGLLRSPGITFGCGAFDQAGREPVEGLPAGYTGLLRLLVRPPVHVSVILQDATLATKLVDRPMDELVFTIERAALERELGGVRARFVDAMTGEPVRDGQAGLDLSSTFSHGGAPLDERGAIQLAERAPGLYRLRFFQRDYAYFERSVRIHAGGIEDLGDVPVWRTATLRGTVVDAHGRPVTASLHATPLAHLRSPADVTTSSTSALGGIFTLDRAARTSLQLVVTAQGHAPLLRTIDASGGDVGGLELRLEEGVRVVLRAPDEARGRQVTIADANGLPFQTWRWWGRTTVLHLSPGTYQVWTGEAERIDTVEELVAGTQPVDWTLRSAR